MDNSVDKALPRPWMMVNDKGWLLCLMCPKHDKPNYYVGVNLKRKGSSARARWVYHHRNCGFAGCCL